MKLGYLPDGTGTAAPFNALFSEHVNVVRHGMDDVDAIVLWGGEDISPSYYQQKPHPYTQNMGKPSSRDINEWKAMTHAKWNNIPIIGVCRGAQFLCAFSGGKLIQHVTHHHTDHEVTTSDGRSMITSSCHHQMLYPWDVEHEMLAWTTKSRSDCYEDENEQEIPTMKARVEPEVVFFPQTRGLAIQGHPEWMDTNSAFVQYCLEMVEKLLLVEKESSK